MSIKTISPQELAKLQAADEKLVLIDVRTPLEFRTVRVAFAENIPMDELDQAAAARLVVTSAPVYVICHAGGRSTKACEQLAQWGMQNVFSVDGGTQAWRKAGLPVIEDRRIISLERQVRIAAGLLVVAGGALALTVHLSFVALAIFVGAGLIFAGVTDSCAMGFMLAKMPWNRGEGTPPCPPAKNG